GCTDSRWACPNRFRPTCAATPGRPRRASPRPAAARAWGTPPGRRSRGSRSRSACCRTARACEELDQVPLGIGEERRPLAPGPVLRRRSELDARGAEALVLRIDDVTVGKPERDVDARGRRRALVAVVPTPRLEHEIDLAGVERDPGVKR